MEGGRYLASALIRAISVSTLYAIAIGANTWLALYLQFDLIKDHLLIIIANFALGAWIAAMSVVIALGLFKIRFTAYPTWFRITVILLSLTGLTIGVTAGIFALEYRNFFAQWHAPTFSKIWFFEQFFTLAGAFYQFAVLGLRLYLPLTPFIVFLATIILSRRIS